MTKLQVACKGQFLSLQIPECHPFHWIDKIICTLALCQQIEIKHKGKDVGCIWTPPFSLFNQRRKTDMSNHNKTSAGKWAFAITVSQPPLERPPFLDINQRFMDRFLHSLFNYNTFFIYLTTEDFWCGLITSLLAITFFRLVFICFFSLPSFIVFWVITLFFCSVPSE